jgi:hypothetical protein
MLVWRVEHITSLSVVRQALRLKDLVVRLLAHQLRLAFQV